MFSENIRLREGTAFLHAISKFEKEMCSYMTKTQIEWVCTWLENYYILQLGGVCLNVVSNLYIYLVYLLLHCCMHSNSIIINHFSIQSLSDFFFAFSFIMSTYHSFLLLWYKIRGVDCPINDLQNYSVLVIRNIKIQLQ